MQKIGLKVGDLAKQTGVSVRTLHYYDEISLLSPSHRTEAGYRLYDRDDIIRLQQIVSLRHIGFSLEEIADCLAKEGSSFAGIIQMHLGKLRQQIALSQKLITRLEAIDQMVNSMESVSIDDLIQAIEVMNLIEKYYTPEQLERLQQRQESLGDERMKQSQADWQLLIDQVQLEMQKGTDPKSEVVQALVQKRQELIAEFTGGDPDIEQSLDILYQKGAVAMSRGTLDEALAEYMSRAIQSSTR